MGKSKRAVAKEHRMARRQLDLWNRQNNHDVHTSRPLKWIGMPPTKSSTVIVQGGEYTVVDELGQVIYSEKSPDHLVEAWRVGMFHSFRPRPLTPLMRSKI